MRLTGRDRGLDRGTALPARLALLALLALGPVLGLPAAGPARCETATPPIVILALNGFDPVSYFLPDGPRPGSARFELSWRGRVWRFASAANREVFRDDPEVYAPRLGGHDAAGILDRRIVDPDPAVFAVIDGRLYLFRDAERRARLLADPGLALAAEAVWPTLRRLTDGLPQ